MLISTRLLDGESNDKDRYVTGRAVDVLLASVGVPQPQAPSDAQFARHMNILRQGCQISKCQHRFGLPYRAPYRVTILSFGRSSSRSV